jgi:ketosteroid isomerase-like protein
MRHLLSIPALLLLLSGLAAPSAAGAAQAASPSASQTAAVAKVIDAFHTAASKADEKAYFDLLAPNGVFLGTDATERWDKEAFRAFAHPHFSQGKGWTFTPRDRHVDLSRNGQVAWFDELLDSATYGECRGSGVLEKLNGQWKITQYHLTIPMPNDLAKDLVARIREAKKAPQAPQ